MMPLIIIGLVVVLFIAVFTYLEMAEKNQTQEKNIKNFSKHEYEVKYNAKNKKFYINISAVNSRGAKVECPQYNRFLFIKYFSTATQATVEMEKMKGNFH